MIGFNSCKKEDNSPKNNELTNNDESSNNNEENTELSDGQLSFNGEIFVLYPDIYNYSGSLCESVQSMNGSAYWSNAKNFVHNTDPNKHIRLIIKTNGKPPIGSKTYQLKGSSWWLNAANSPDDYARLQIDGQSGGSPYIGAYATSELGTAGTLTVTNNGSGDIKYDFTNVVIYGTIIDSAVVSGRSISCQ